MKIPDVLALTLPEALARLADCGWRLGRVVETKPPWAGSPGGESRVLRQQAKSDGTLDLLVAAPRFVRGGVREK